MDGSAILLKENESGLSVNWLEYFDDRTKPQQLVEIRRLIRLTLRRTGLFAELNVGATRKHIGDLLNELRFISGIEGLQQLKCNALILHGDEDSIVPYSSSERFARMYEHCTLINIPGTDHGFGVGDDEDLSSPATKEKHREVWNIISRFIEEANRE